MLSTEPLDHKRSDDPTLLGALRNRDPLALAEAYHRTVQAAHACARRLLSSPVQIETLLRAVYRQLWEDPPQGVPLEGWVRARCYALATDDLRDRGAAPASPSVAALLPDLPAPDVRYLDAAERALRELDERDRTVLLLAHDCGVAAGTQGGDATAALDRSLRALAGPEPSSADASALHADPCTDVQGMGDWVLGLADQRQAVELEALAVSRPGCAALARTLRRGRRRLEGLPPTPDMGHRILVTVLAVAAPPGPTPSPSHPPNRQAHRRPSDPTGHASPVRKVERTVPVDPADIDTGELQLQELFHAGSEQHEAPRPVAAGRPEPGLSRRRGGEGTITSTEWRSPESMTAVATRDPGMPRVVRLPDDEDTGGFEPHRRPDPYEQLSRLGGSGLDDLDDPEPTGEIDAPVETDEEEELEDFGSFYPEEELITRPSTGQRVFVAIGYMLPIVLGAGLGLYIADLLFNLNR